MNKLKRYALTRLRTVKGERLLGWVFPSTNRYTVITWRRVNPRYDMEGGAFTDINCWNLTDVTFCRFYIGAIWVQLIMGREKWTDGFRQQVVIISPPGSEYLIPPTGISFDDYPTPPNPDLIPDVDKNCMTLPNGDCIAEVACMHSTDVDGYDPTLNLKDSTL